MREKICPYCKKPARLVNGAAIYPHAPHLHTRYFYQCAPCDAYVGCHPGTQRALGSLAKADLRQARSEVHDLFDRMWKSGLKTRSQAYLWLGDHLNIYGRRCHIGMFDLKTCKRASVMLESYLEKRDCIAA